MSTQIDDERITILVNGLDDSGSTIYCPNRSTTTVLQFKNIKLFRLSSHPPSEMKLIFNGYVLEDHSLLSQCNFGHLDILYYIPKMLQSQT